MRQIFTYFVLIVLSSMSASAQEAIAACESAITYDKSEVENNIASRLAVWESIDKETYEKRASGGGLGISVYGIPINLSYDQFDEQRKRLRQSLALQQDLSISFNGKWQAVDAGSTERYMACLDSVNNKKFSVNILAAKRDIVYVRVKKVENQGQFNKDKVVVLSQIGGSLRNKYPIVLAGNAATTLAFRRAVGKPLEVAIVLKNKKGLDIDTATLSIPKFTNISNRPVEEILTSSKVRCEHTYSGPANAPVVLNAGINYVFRVGTQSMQYEILDQRYPNGGVGASFVASPTRIEMLATCASDDNNHTWPINVWFTIHSLRDNFIDIDASIAQKR
jgi:hypothetical protein